MRMARVAALAVTGILCVGSAFAQGRGGGHANPPVVHGNPHADSPSTTTPAASTAVNPIAQKISANPQLESRVTTLLPPGMTLNQASAGFKNQGQFIAAVHVSHNLNIPFAQLKTAMLGTSGPGATKPLSLGQAIHKLRPNVDADDAAKHATSEADADVSLKPSTTTTRR